jgi:ornithine--oxo-acid transaminase
VAVAALGVIQSENLTENAEKMGQIFRSQMEALMNKFPHLLTRVRGKGLLNAVIVNDSEEGHLAWDICLKLAENGLLAKPTHGNIIRFAPPLVITERQLRAGCKIIEKVVAEFA